MDAWEWCERNACRDLLNIKAEVIEAVNYTYKEKPDCVMGFNSSCVVIIRTGTGKTQDVEHKV